MKTLIFLTLTLVCLVPPSFASGIAGKKLPPDLPPDASSEMLEQALSHMDLMSIRMASTPDIDAVVGLGKRNLDWLKHMNSLLPEGKKISFTSKETQGGIPIDSPKEYSPATISASLQSLRDTLPLEMKSVLFGQAPFTDAPPIALDQYIEWGRKTDKAYQTAIRWLMMEPYLSYLAQRRSNDIRGIHFLKKLSYEERRVKLASPKAWSEEERARMTDWFVSLCLNNGQNLGSCRSKVAGAIQAGRDMNPLYDRWQREALDLYNSFFEIPSYAARDDVRFHGSVNPQLLTFPFATPETEEIRRFLADNIEDEWRFERWQLRLAFEDGAAAHVEFEPGVTPHVNGLGGDTITMNSEQPLTEYDAQWTIRHEFGHVLGFPDCYVEFYDEDRASIFNYQIDVDNLMCSRRGHIQIGHVEELRRVYLKP